MAENEKGDVTQTINKLSDSDQTQIAGGISDKEKVEGDEQKSRNLLTRVAYGMEPPRKLDTEILLPPKNDKNK